jgi:hypothetical protein
MPCMDEYWDSNTIKYELFLLEMKINNLTIYAL